MYVYSLLYFIQTVVPDDDPPLGRNMLLYYNTTPELCLLLLQVY